jgi:hypothetical protein
MNALLLSVQPHARLAGSSVLDAQWLRHTSASTGTFEMDTRAAAADVYPHELVSPNLQVLDANRAR